MAIIHDAASHTLELSAIQVELNGTVALEGISFRLAAGEHVAVVGPNGAGKSTLFQVIAGVLQPSSGSITVYGHGPRQHICIGYLPQHVAVDLSFPVTVRDVVMMGRIGKLGFFRRARALDNTRVDQALEAVELGNLAHRQIGELSGGQRQRMFLARALAQEAELLLMDEPMTGLDATSQEDVLWALDKLRGRSVTVLVATHDLNFASDRFDRVALLNRRLLGMGTPAEVFTHDLLTQAYGSHTKLIATPEGSAILSDTCCDGRQKK